MTPSKITPRSRTSGDSASRKGRRPASPDEVKDHLQTIVERLSVIDRRATTPGERESAELVASEMLAAGAADVELETGRAVSSWAWTLVPHALVGLLAAARRGWASRLLAAGAIVSYEADYTGRNRWLRRLLPAGQTTNVVGRLAAKDEARRTLVFVAHHDAAHTGWIFHPRALGAYRSIAARTGTTPAYSTPFYLALAATASRHPALRLVGVAQILNYIALSLQAASSPTAPGANDNATGVAALLELAREIAHRRFVEADVLFVSPGAEEVGVDGMAAWVSAHRSELDPATTLVVNLDSLGGGEPVVVERESWTAHYRQEDLAWVDRGARRAGIAPPTRVRMAVNTDGMVARHAGLAAVSVLSMTDGWLGKFHQADDTPENVDWDAVTRCLELARGIADEFAGAREE